MDCPECGASMATLFETPIHHCPGCGRFFQPDEDGAWVDWTKEGLRLLAHFTPGDVDARALAVLASGGREALRLSACIAQQFKANGL